jgi:hypothetical protein
MEIDGAEKARLALIPVLRRSNQSTRLGDMNLIPTVFEDAV